MLITTYQKGAKLDYTHTNHTWQNKKVENLNSEKLLGTPT